MRRARPPIVALGVALALAVPAGAGAGSPAEDLGWLNAKRALHGIPGDVAADADWSAACGRHVAYMRSTGTVTHGEDPASPAFSAEGDWAGNHAVLASAPPWTAADFIWERAPLHLAQLMAPQLARTGIADDGQFVCVTTLPGYTRPVPASARVVTYPGNGEPIYASEVAEEWPQTPAQALGLPQPTGPNLLAFRWGGASDGDVGVRRVELDGPRGRLRVRWIDRDHPAVGPYLPPDAAIIVPVTPLARDAQYAALVEFDDGTVHAWGFSTADSPSATVIRRTRLSARVTGTRRFCAQPIPGGCAAWATRRRVAIDLAGRILGRTTGTPVAGTAVDVRRPDLTTKRVRTDADGRFAVRLIAYAAPGQSALRVSAAVPGDAIRSWAARIRPAR